MVKVIRHKTRRHRRRMVQCYSTGNGNVSSHEGTLASPGEYDWTRASFGPFLSTTETANELVQPFLHSLRQKVPILHNGRPYPPELPFPMGDLDLPCNTWCFGPCEPTTQTAPRSLQPCLHRWPQSVPILVCLFPPSELFLPMLASGPHVIHGSLGPTEFGTQMATWSFQLLLQGSLLTSVTDWQSDRQTDRPGYSVLGGVIMRN